MVMGNSHLVMNRTNKLAIIASHCQESHFLYPSKHWKAGDMTGDDSGLGSGDGKYELLSVANDLIAEEVRRLMARTKISGHQTDTMLAGSLAKALCCIPLSQDMKSRILVIRAAEDCALQYMNFMNVIFAAQKNGVLIDACVLASDSGLLQQAHATSTLLLVCVSCAVGVPVGLRPAFPVGPASPSARGLQGGLFLPSQPH
uniref:General transcription factor IIH subunit 3 n=1 Tax=Paramormyrops kingsleyae TaxID=1676925 RepID=A0A3B3QR48_9TELE